MKNLLFFALVIVFLASPAFAAELTVEKLVKEENISVGSPVTVVLRFDNPFDSEVAVRIVDSNIFANNGIDVQCLEAAIPNRSRVDVEYSPITAHSEGSYTLEKATVNYTNPKTKDDMIAESNEYDIEVAAGAQGVAAEGITAIYRCDGINMQSTSYSSSSQSQQQSQSEEERQQQEEEMQNTQNKLQNIDQQSGQNMQGLRQEMQEEMQRQEAEKQEMMKEIESDPKMYEEHQKLDGQGYQLSEKNINPAEEGGAEFEYNYRKENGDTASIKGEVNNGTVENLLSWSSDEGRRLMEKLENSSEFREAVRGLEKEGFQTENRSISPSSSNMTNFNYQLSNPATNETARVYGNMTREGNVTSIEVEKEDGSHAKSLIFLIIGAALGYYVWNKYLRKEMEIPVISKPVKKRPLSHRKEALRMLDVAERMYNYGRKKQAYEKASEALRFYLRHEFESDKKELTASDALKLVRDSGRNEAKKVKEFFNICNLVNFAKYEANKKDFDKIIRIGEGVVGRCRCD